MDLEAIYLHQVILLWVRNLFLLWGVFRYNLIIHQATVGDMTHLHLKTYLQASSLLFPDLSRHLLKSHNLALSWIVTDYHLLITEILIEHLSSRVQVQVFEKCLCLLARLKFLFTSESLHPVIVIVSDQGTRSVTRGL